MTTTVLKTKISEVENKIANTSGLVTTTILNTKISKVENKTHSVGVLVKETEYDAKMKDIEGKYFTTADYNKFTRDILDVKIKQKQAVNKSDIDKKLININKKITSNKTKHIEADKKLTDLAKRVAQISAKGYDFLLGRMYFTSDDGYSLILDSNKKVTNWILTGISSEKNKSFDTGLEQTMSNFAKGRVN